MLSVVLTAVVDIIPGDMTNCRALHWLSLEALTGFYDTKAHFQEILKMILEMVSILQNNKVNALLSRCMAMVLKEQVVHIPNCL